MAWFVVYDTATGAARSITEDAPKAAELTAKGLSVFAAAPGQDPRGMKWDPAAKTLSAFPPGPVLVDPREFIRAFTAAEWKAVKGSTDDRIAQFIDFVMAGTDPINARANYVGNMFDRMVTLTLLTQVRRDAIVADMIARNF